MFTSSILGVVSGFGLRMLQGGLDYTRKKMYIAQEMRNHETSMRFARTRLGILRTIQNIDVDSNIRDGLLDNVMRHENASLERFRSLDLQKHYITGIPLVDGLTALTRPILTFALLGVLTAFAWQNIGDKAFVSELTESLLFFFDLVMSYWFYGRTAEKMSQLGVTKNRL